MKILIPLLVLVVAVILIQTFNKPTLPKGYGEHGIPLSHEQIDYLKKTNQFTPTQEK